MLRIAAHSFFGKVASGPQGMNIHCDASMLESRAFLLLVLKPQFEMTSPFRWVTLNVPSEVRKFGFVGHPVLAD
jgi:hypothetical protein